MSFNDMVIKEAARIVKNDKGWGIAAKIKPKGSTTVFDIVVLQTKHHLSVDSDGLPVNSMIAGVSIIESDLITLGIPPRNNKGNVDMNGWTIATKSSTGIEQTYMINQWFPDENLGMITVTLSTYEQQT